MYKNFVECKDKILVIILQSSILGFQKIELMNVNRFKSKGYTKWAAQNMIDEVLQTTSNHFFSKKKMCV